MNSPEPDRTARASVLDRLIDLEPKRAADPAPTWDESVAELKASVLRDIEWLLNTRRIATPAPDAYPEVQRSVYHYGLPDLSSLSGDADATQRRLLRQVEECLTVFEPRLESVRVSPVETKAEGRREIRLTVEALLRMEPNPERVMFDTVVEITSGKVRLTGEHDAG